ncbi:MAG: NADH:ubiquinone reductase (Na(+)-transporting) subunit D [Lentisphaeria bacterium]|nr:NADH:ubiquinone reductase (Na(+)-transporting) subunit D [Lentisphaeria bacterium]NQZ66736.1 NADH:ubiquinone reductase (Na(+)-transporting) subunit D [Lentisphaeria bacterium]
MDGKLLKDPMLSSNPVTILALGICSALAVTGQMMPSMTMGIAVTVVIVVSSTVVSAIKNYIPARVSIICQMTVIATLVILVDQVLKAYQYETSKQLSVFVGLIITNCIVMGRTEGFAMGNKPGASMLDGLGNGLAYAIILIIISFVRELFGSGTLFGAKMIPQSFYDAGYVDNGLLVLPPAAFFILGFIIWAQKEWMGRKDPSVFEE